MNNDTTGSQKGKRSVLEAHFQYSQTKIKGLK